LITDVEVRDGPNDLYPRMSFGVRGTAGRLYLTTGDFGIDVNVTSVHARVEQSYRGWSTSYHSRGMSFFDQFAHGEVISLQCEIDRGFSVFTPTRARKGQVFLELGDRCLLLSPGQKPAPPRPAIWLPGGVWNCEFCSSAQLSDLLQCRNCGAPRFGVDPE
jgi:hypothetical protein